MRRFFPLVSAWLLALLLPLQGKACIAEAPTHNAYLFSVYDQALMAYNPFMGRVNDYWRSYVGSNDEHFDRLNARQKGDREATAYLTLLYAYVRASANLNGWDYPTKKEVAHYNKVVADMLAAARAYRGKRFRAQYLLMQMRALFAQKNYK